MRSPHPATAATVIHNPSRLGSWVELHSRRGRCVCVCVRFLSVSIGSISYTVSLWWEHARTPASHCTSMLNRRFPRLKLMLM
ncbi:hypothetical protein Mapa_001460 [Marchantia paleacea]|nr:hypothetical protein Mapa_001460 [Marchantia paleacea]